VGNTGSHSLARYLRPRRSLRRLADMQALARHEQDQGKAITETVMSVVRLNGGVPLLHAMVNSPMASIGLLNSGAGPCSGRLLGAASLCSEKCQQHLPLFADQANEALRPASLLPFKICLAHDHPTNRDILDQGIGF
jgi:hypothetical protein